MRAISESQKKPSSVLETAVSEGLFSGTGLAHLPIGKKEHIKILQIVQFLTIEIIFLI